MCLILPLCSVNCSFFFFFPRFYWKGLEGGWVEDLSKSLDVFVNMLFLFSGGDFWFDCILGVHVFVFSML